MGVGGERFVLEVEVLVFYLVVHVEIFFLECYFCDSHKISKKWLFSQTKPCFSPAKAGAKPAENTAANPTTHTSGAEMHRALPPPLFKKVKLYFRRLRRETVAHHFHKLVVRTVVHAH